jgi:tyrosine aminotransferase
MAINVLCSPGDAILLPSPGFSLYQTICQSRGIQCLFYQCMPEKSWEINLDQVETLLQESGENGIIKAFLINNPSNPCGSVYSLNHTENILQVAEKFKVPIIADEVYHGMVFSHASFHPFGQVSQRVPILCCGGLTKRFLVPGWRIGWVLIYDKTGVLSLIRKGLHDLATIILGPNSFTQAAIPEIFKSLPASYYDDINRNLEVKGMAYIANV